MESKMSSKRGQGKDKFSNDEMKILSEYNGRAYPAFYVAIAFLAIFAYSMVYNKFDFSKLNKTLAKDLKDYSSRVQYVMFHLTPGITWIIISMHYVVHKRLSGPAINPLLGYEKVVESAKNNLNNSIEQFLMSAVSQLIFVIHLEPNTIVNVIPALNLLFIIGRITFWLGYPDYRTFGFVVTSYPTTTIAVYNLYKIVCLYI